MDTDQDHQTADEQRAEIMAGVETMSPTQLIMFAAAAKAIKDARRGRISAALADELHALIYAQPLILEDIEWWLRTHHYVRPVWRDDFKLNYLIFQLGPNVHN